MRQAQTHPSSGGPAHKWVVAVPEAVIDATLGTVNFKIMANRELLALDPYPEHVTRTFQQITWLHGRLCQTRSDCIIPSLPDAPTYNRQGDARLPQEYIEKKRRQVERYLTKVLSREKVDHDDILFFLSNDMNDETIANRAVTTLDTAVAKLGQMKLFDRNTKYEKGFRVYRPREQVFQSHGGNDNQVDFEKRRMYLLLLETYLSQTLDAAHGLFRARDAIGKHQVRIAQCFLELCQPELLLGNANDSDTNAARMIKGLSAFSNGMETQHELNHALVRDEIFKLGDVLLEYKNMIPSAKTLMNHRTNSLASYDEAIRSLRKAKEKVHNLASRKSAKPMDMAIAKANVTEAERDHDERALAYEKMEESLGRELVYFERLKVRDLKGAFSDYLDLQLEHERRKLDAFLELQRHMACCMSHDHPNGHVAL